MMDHPYMEAKRPSAPVMTCLQCNKSWYAGVPGPVFCSKDCERMWKALNRREPDSSVRNSVKDPFVNYPIDLQ